MKEPTTIKEARDYTLRKIEKCMELPIGKRGNFWIKKRWLLPDSKKHCAFCIVAKQFNFNKVKSCSCTVKKICQWYVKEVQFKWHKVNLRTLHRMVKEVEV